MSKPYKPKRTKSKTSGKHRANKNVYFNDDGDDPVDMSSPIVQAFQHFQHELDAKHDKYERLVKISRDITIESKRSIFLLHRISSEEEKDSILKEANDKLRFIERKLLKFVALELKNEDAYMFLRAVSPGLQEYIEAVSFFQYLKDKSLVGQEDIQNRLTFDVSQQDRNADEMESSVLIPLPVSDYILGIADMTGELMRQCIMSVSKHHNLAIPFEICSFLRQIYNGMRATTNAHFLIRELSSKERTLKHSLDKVEKACYMIQVRGSEMPKHMLANIFTLDSNLNHGNHDNGSEYNTCNE